MEGRGLPGEGLVGPARGPVDGVLQHAGDGVVVFRAGDQQRVGGADGLAEGRDRLGPPGGLHVGVVERDGAEIEDIQAHALGQQLRRDAQQAAVGRSPVHGPGETQNADRRRHDLLPFRMRWGKEW